MGVRRPQSLAARAAMHNASLQDNLQKQYEHQMKWLASRVEREVEVQSRTALNGAVAEGLVFEGFMVTIGSHDKADIVTPWLINKAACRDSTEAACPAGFRVEHTFNPQGVSYAAMFWLEKETA